MASTTDTESRQSSFFVHALHVFVLISFAVAQPLYDIIRQYPTFLVAHDAGPKEIVLLVLLLSFGAALVPLAAEGMVGLFSESLRKGIHAIVVFVSLVLIFLPPLAKLDIDAGSVTVAIATILAGALTLAYLAVCSIRSLATALTVAVIFFPLIFLFTKPVSDFIFPKEAPSFETSPLDSTPPIVMVVLDEFSSISLLDDRHEIDSDRFPHIAAFAKEAHWFRNATTNSDVTDLALPAILTGLMPSRRPAVPPTLKNYPNNLFVLLGGNYELNVVESGTSLCPDHGPGISLWKSFTSLLLDIGVVYFHIILPPDMAKGLPAVSQNWGGFLQDTDATHATRWRVEIPGGLGGKGKVFREFISSIGNSSSPALNFLHIILPHVPYQHLPSGKKYGRVLFRPHGGDNEFWGGDELGIATSYQRYLLQVQFVDTLIGEMIQRLKEVGLYDETLIILVGDHGVSFVPNDERRILSEGNVAEIISIPLIIKTPHQANGVIDDRNVESIDILPMIAEVLGVNAGWTFDGTSLLDPSTKDRSRKTVYAYRGNTYHFDAEFREKYSALEKKLGLFGTGKDPLNLYRFGPNKELVGQHLDELDVVGSPQHMIYVHEANLLADIDPLQPILPAAISGYILSASATNRKAERDVAIAVNGTILSVTRTFLNGTQERFAAMIPETSLRKGANRVEVFLVRKGQDNLVQLLGSGHSVPARNESRAKRHGRQTTR